MSENEVVDDLNLPWCLAIEEDPSWIRIPADSLVVKASTANALTAELLHNDRGIRDMRSYLSRETSDTESPGKHDVSDSEGRIIMSLGDGLSGAAKRCHGGFISLMMDEVTGELAWHVLKGDAIATAQLNVSYKRMLMLPAVVLCKAWVTRFEGRKVYLGCSIEDGNDGLYATGEAVFVRIDRRL